MEKFIRAVANFIDTHSIKKLFGTHLEMNIRYFNIVMTILCIATSCACFVVFFNGTSYKIIALLILVTVFVFLMYFLGNVTKKYNLFITIITYLFNLVFLPCLYFIGDTIKYGVWLYFIGGLVLSILFVRGPAFVITIIVQPIYYLAIFYISYYYRDFFDAIDFEETYNSFIESPHFFLILNFIVITTVVGMLIKTLFVSYIDKRSMALSMVNKLEDLSHKDPLTGTYNRRYLFSYLEDMIKSADKDNVPISIVMYDIDKFKSLNDNYGHVIGDEVLCAISKILVNNCREYDIVARYGGEEFILVFPGLKESIAFTRADQIRQEVENAVFNPLITAPVTISGGVARYEPGMTAARVIGIADENLYQAKNSGRNRIIWKRGAPSPIKKSKQDSPSSQEKFGRRFSDIFFSTDSEHNITSGGR